MEMTSPTKTPRKTLPSDLPRMLKRLHHSLDVIFLCVRRYVAYSLSLCNLEEMINLEEMMAERGFEVFIRRCTLG